MVACHAALFWPWINHTEPERSHCCTRFLRTTSLMKIFVVRVIGLMAEGQEMESKAFSTCLFNLFFLHEVY